MGPLEALLALPGVDAPTDDPSERIRLLEPPLLGTEWILASKAMRLWRVFHEDYELCVLPPDGNERNGGASYTYRQWHIPCRPGATYLFEPDTLHANDRLFGPSDYYVVKIRRETFTDLARELGAGPRPHFRLASTSSRRVMASVASLAGAVSRRADQLEVETRLLETLRDVLAESAEAPLPDVREGIDPAVRRARDHLHDRLAEPVSLADLAAVSGLDRYHVVRAFARAYGLPPHAYQIQLRVAEARRRIANGTAVSAVDVGFYDQSHLIRHFKRAYAVTPAAYRRAVMA